MTTSAKKYPDAAAFILAGGRSSRMGRDKAWLGLAGVPLVLRIARAVEPLVSSVTVIGHGASDAGRFEILGLAAIPDRLPARAASGESSCGPLGGIVTALNATRCSWNLVLACDLPYITTAWLQWLLGRGSATEGTGAQAVVPERTGSVEPLAAVYRKECAQALAAALGRGVRKVSEALDDLRVARIPEAEWRALDPEGNVLANMNTPEEYARACQWWDEKEKRKAAVR
jgi:molybdopterin-guanine dinucleotide biosynthesis protein A